MSLDSVLAVIDAILSVVAAAFLGVLLDWLLGKILPVDPKLSHIIAGVIAIIVLVLCAASPVLFDVVNSARAGTVTRAQVEEWSVGEADRNTVYDLIYNQIHIIPGKRQFMSGTTIPDEVLITTDLGNNWSQYPVKVVARNGGWGVFETTDSFKVPTTGEYWLIVP